ncbi:DUF4276 family protein [Paraburkholderia sp. UCT2]|uniref:DUF4276 family protein n=1 Tax=Paraburkholderia sp. UCT2 TaxID=2615208 RepID=UPI001CA42881|nr:DUF4276 family protein [Paraburkholderia sp. UCT2]
MKILLEGLLPRFLPGLTAPEHFQCVPHEGKSDLDRSISRKLKAWREPGVRFVIVRDNDNANCADLKQRLAKICAEAGRADTLIRLVCQELESWYLGDVESLTIVFSDIGVSTTVLRKRFSDPDVWQKPSVELKRIAPSFQKLSGARTMSAVLSVHDNRSDSFRTFAAGVQRIAVEMGYVENG